MHELPGSMPPIFRVDLEVHRGGLVEDQLHVQAQQVPREDLALYRFLVRLQKVPHRNNLRPNTQVLWIWYGLRIESYPVII